MSSLIGRFDWNLQQDRDGHRDYSISWLIKAGFLDDGPFTVLQTPGLPLPGAPWAFGNDDDPYAYCWPDMRARPVNTKERDWLWIVDQKYSTRPLRRCQDTPVENPLAEPPTPSGNFVKFTEEAGKDRHGKTIRNSAGERIRGSIMEFDSNRPRVAWDLNASVLPLALYSEMVDTVNDAPLWGLEKRMIKLSDVAWTRKLYGTCTYYYGMHYEFDINKDTFDRYVPDEGTRCLIGWSPGSHSKKKVDPEALDPDVGIEKWKLRKYYETYLDAQGNPGRCFLDGMGRPAESEDDVGEIKVEKYSESNLLLLGVPSSF